MKGKLSILYGVMLSSIYCYFLQVAVAVGTLFAEGEVRDLHEKMGDYGSYSD